ncbi:hypothetical protein [Ekhidna sp.]|uniref:hypothetical protein n=1 Tax=Ekhidna sp. TaxID=2608089 RepID=UPI003B514D95
MEHDYSLFVENLKGRRYDEALREQVLSDSFHKCGYSDCLRYTLESMVEIDASYAYKVYANSRRIHEIISKTLKKKGYNMDYRYQGALKTYSNILLYGDVEIIAIKKNVTEKPHADMQTLAMDIMDILRKDPTFKSVDYSDKTRIRITAQKPTCEIDVLPSLWIDSAEYLKTKNEIYRGIAEFDFANRKVKKYLPFLNIARINAKDQHSNGHLKAMSRLLKSLKSDSDERIDLKDSEINAILYNIPEADLTVPPNKVLSLLPLVSELLEKLGNEREFFALLLSPSEKDRVFGGRPEKQQEVKKLNTVLKQLIVDLKQELDPMNKSITSEVEYL